MTRTRTRTAFLAAALIAATLQIAPATANPQPEHCAATPKPARGQARDVLAVARRAKEELGLKSVLLRVERNGHEVVTGALGESMTGVPATADMHFRSGSVGIVYMATTLLELVDEGKVDLDDPISRWLPEVPHADEITLRMLGSTTSGFHDYVTDPEFLTALTAAPFKHWTPAELAAYPYAHPLWYEPGTNWSYSHLNFLLLGQALEKITGTRLDRLLQQRVMGPLGLRDTRNAFTPEIQPPALHAFSGDRGFYEETTFWNPSWTTAPGAVLTSHICDLARSARAIGTGELLSEEAFHEQLDPGTVGLGHPTATCPETVCRPQTEAKHFGFGVIVVNGWIFSNPSFTGYAAIQAHLPEKGLSIAVSTTKGPHAADGNTAQAVAARIAAQLAPGHPLGDLV